MQPGFYFISYFIFLSTVYQLYISKKNRKPNLNKLIIIYNDTTLLLNYLLSSFDKMIQFFFFEVIKLSYQKNLISKRNNGNNKYVLESVCRKLLIGLKDH